MPSGEFEKFVLQYLAETSSAVKNLEELQRKVRETDKTTKAARGSFSEFANTASNELNRIIPGVNAVTGAVRTMTGTMALATAAAGTLAFAVKSVIDTRNQYNNQRMAGQFAGVSDVRIENLQRGMAQIPGSYLTREKVQDNLVAMSRLIEASYTDPTRTNRESRALRLLGTDPGKRGDFRVNTMDAMSNLARQLQGASAEQVMGVAPSLGLTPDFLRVVKQMGPEGVRKQYMSDQEINDRMAGDKAVSGLNDQLTRLNQNWTTLENHLAQKMIPTLNTVIEKVNWFFESTRKNVESNTGNGHVDATTSALGGGKVNSLAAQLGEDAKKSENGIMKFIRENWSVHDIWQRMTGGDKKEDQGNTSNIKSAADTTKNAASVAGSASDLAKKTTEQGKTQLDKLDELNESQAKARSEFELAVNMFVGATSTFAHAVDERQAWAAWAGEVGRDSGLRGPSGLPNYANQGRPFVPGGADPRGPAHDRSRIMPDRYSKAYDPLFLKYAEQYGLDPQLIRAVAAQESSMNPNAQGELLKDGTRAQGLMQLTKENQRKFSVDNPFDPEQSIRAGAQLLKANLDWSRGDVTQALRGYFGGWDQRNWGPKTLAYPSQVMSKMGAGLQGGESRDRIALLETQQNVSQRLGAPTEQLQQGLMSKSDVAWKTRQMLVEMANESFRLTKELMNPALPDREKSRLTRELQTVNSDFLTLSKNRGQVVDAQKEDRGRVITNNELGVTINISGVELEGSTLLDQIKDKGLREEMFRMLNAASSGIQY